MAQNVAASPPRRYSQRSSLSAKIRRSVRRITGEHRDARRSRVKLDSSLRKLANHLSTGQLICSDTGELIKRDVLMKGVAAAKKQSAERS